MSGGEGVGDWNVVCVWRGEIGVFCVCVCMFGRGGGLDYCV